MAGVLPEVQGGRFLGSHFFDVYRGQAGDSSAVQFQHGEFDGAAPPWTGVLVALAGRDHADDKVILALVQLVPQRRVHDRPERLPSKKRLLVAAPAALERIEPGRDIHEEERLAVLDRQQLRVLGELARSKVRRFRRLRTRLVRDGVVVRSAGGLRCLFTGGAPPTEASTAILKNEVNERDRTRTTAMGR
jgi:hypothetical protein